MPHQKKCSQQGIDTKSAIKQALLHHCFCENGYHDSSLTFSWESQYEAIKQRERAKEILENTDTLIVIGYSFPTFNRELDGLIVNTLAKSTLAKPESKSVIVQTPSKESYESIKNRIQHLNKSSVLQISHNFDVKEFYIPYDLI